MPLLVVNLDEQLLDEFRRFAVNKRGKIHGVLKPEVKLALRNHLSRSKKSEAVGGVGLSSLHSQWHMPFFFIRVC